MAFVEARLEDDQTEELEAHIDVCPACNQLLAELARDATLATVSLQDTEPAGAGIAPQPERRDLPGPGETLGRYRLLRVLGSGAMGVVYLALDPQLDRKIALKLVGVDAMRTEEGAEARADGIRDRLMREALALARLSHPNIVSVHDVGVYRGYVFMAMEYVQGPTLREWLSDERRSWSEIASVFAQAGRGLHEAHQAGVVHRDFKPDNVMIDRKGRIRVLDFGLAHVGDPMTASHIRGHGTDRRLDPFLTRPGTILGTPAYMPPEQHRGLATDARSDQFSFCVALYEALYGERPFAGGTLSELSKSACAGKLPAEPTSSRIPRRIRALLERGLAVERADRFPSMAELLVELEHNPGSRRRRWAMAMVAVLIMALIGERLYSRAQDREALCQPAYHTFADIWNDRDRATIEDAFLAIDKPYASAAWSLVESALDDYRERWVATHRAACEATNIRHERSAGFLDQEMACLDDRLEHFGALVEVLRTVDASAVERAADMVGGLGAVESCTDASYLDLRLKPPERPGQRQAVEKQRDELARAAALDSAGRFADTVDVARRVESRALEIGYRPLLAEALLRKGAAQREMGTYDAAIASLTDAFFAARQSRYDEVAAAAATELVTVYSSGKVDPAEGQRWARHARSEGRVLFDSAPAVEARILDAEGRLFDTMGTYDPALDNFQRAIAIWQEVRGPQSVEVARSMRFVTDSLRALGKHDEALTHAEKSWAIFEAKLGAEHPQAVKALATLAALEGEMGKHSLALEHYDRAIAAYQKAVGPDHLNIAVLLSNAGTVLSSMGKYDQALAYYRRALAIDIAISGPESPDVASDHVNIAVALGRMGKYDDEAAKLDLALAIWKRSLGPGHPSVGLALTNLGENRLRRGNFRQAVPFVDRAIAVFEKALGDDAPVLANPLTIRARARMGFRDWAAAIADLERALELQIQGSPDSVTTALIRFTLAKALARGGRPPERALRLAEQARDQYAANGDDWAEDRAEVETWLNQAR